MDIRTPLNNKNNRMPYFNRYQTMSRQVEISISLDGHSVDILEIPNVAMLKFHHFNFSGKY